MSPGLNDLNSLSASAAGLLPGTGAAPQGPQKEMAAAKDFEAILIGQMLQSAHETSAGWLGSDDDDASSTAVGFGEQELAKAIAQAGGLGLSKIIAAGLAAKAAAANGSSGPAEPQSAGPAPFTR